MVDAVKWDSSRKYWAFPGYSCCNSSDAFKRKMLGCQYQEEPDQIKHEAMVGEHVWMIGVILYMLPLRVSSGWIMCKGAKYEPEEALSRMFFFASEMILIALRFFWWRGENQNFYPDQLQKAKHTAIKRNDKGMDGTVERCVSLSLCQHTRLAIWSDFRCKWLVLESNWDEAPFHRLWLLVEGDEEQKLGQSLETKDWWSRV